MTKERWAQIGITTDFLIVVRTLGELFRLKHVLGTNFSTAVAALYVGGALIAVCSCWTGVSFYSFRRYMLSASITLGAVLVLLVYKIAAIRLVVAISVPSLNRGRRIEFHDEVGPDEGVGQIS